MTITKHIRSYPLIQAVFNTVSTDEALARYNGYTVTILGEVEWADRDRTEQGAMVYVHPSHGETFKALTSELSRTWNDYSAYGPVAAAYARGIKNLITTEGTRPATDED